MVTLLINGVSMQFILCCMPLNFKDMTTKKRKFKCTGCGEDRPCFLETNQEPNPLDAIEDLFTEDLKCVLDSTNQTSYNWKEVTYAD